MKWCLNILPVLAAALMLYVMVPVHGSSALAESQGIAEYSFDQNAGAGSGGGGDENIFNRTPEGSAANTKAIKTAGTNGTPTSCDDIAEAKEGVLIGRIVPCLIHTIESTTSSFSAKMIEWLRPLVYSFFVLVIALFGVKMLQGEQQMGAQAFSLVLKVAFVIGIMELIPNTFVPMAYNIMKDGVSITATAFGPDQMSISCEVDKYGGQNTPLLWKQMDCMLGKLFGFATGKPTVAGGTQVNVILGASAVGLLTGFMFGGTLGVTVFFALIGVLWTVMMLIVRVVLAFLNGYLIVCIMLIIAPLFLPLVLLKITQDYFEKWWKAILGGIMLPIVISAFSMFALYAYDQLLFKPDSRLQHLFKYEEVKEAMELPKRTCDLNVTGTVKSKSNKANPDKGDLDKLMESPFLYNPTQQLLSGASDACSMLSNSSVFNVAKVKSYQRDGKDMTKLMTELFIEAITLLIMAFLISQGVDRVESVISSFTGSGLTREAELETRMQSTFQSFKGKLSQGLSTTGEDGRSVGLRGEDFVNKFPEAARNAIDDFKSKLQNKR